MMEMWAIKPTWEPDILAHTVRPTRREAIEQVAAPPELSWKSLYRQGMRAVRVRVEDTTNDARLAA